MKLSDKAKCAKKWHQQEIKIIIVIEKSINHFVLSESKIRFMQLNFIPSIHIGMEIKNEIFCVVEWSEQSISNLRYLACKSSILLDTTTYDNYHLTPGLWSNAEWEIKFTKINNPARNGRTVDFHWSGVSRYSRFLRRYLLKKFSAKGHVYKS